MHLFPVVTVLGAEFLHRKLTRRLVGLSSKLQNDSAVALVAISPHASYVVRRLEKGSGPCHYEVVGVVDADYG